MNKNNEQRFELGDGVYISGSVSALMNIVTAFNAGLNNLEFENRISDCFFAIEAADGEVD